MFDDPKGPIEHVSWGKEVEVLVIGMGIDGAIECPEKVCRAIRENGIGKLVVRPTVEACSVYNRLYREGRHVAMLAHGTC